LSFSAHVKNVTCVRERMAFMWFLWFAITWCQISHVGTEAFGKASKY